MSSDYIGGLVDSVQSLEDAYEAIWRLSRRFSLPATVAFGINDCMVQKGDDTFSVGEADDDEVTPEMRRALEESPEWRWIDERLTEIGNGLLPLLVINGDGSWEIVPGA